MDLLNIYTAMTGLIIAGAATALALAKQARDAQNELRAYEKQLAERAQSEAKISPDAELGTRFKVAPRAPRDKYWLLSGLREAETVSRDSEALLKSGIAQSPLSGPIHANDWNGDLASTSRSVWVWKNFTNRVAEFTFEPGKYRPRARMQRMRVGLVRPDPQMTASSAESSKH